MRLPYIVIRLVAASLLFVGACGPQLKGPKGISVPVYDALGKAIEAIARANEYRDAGSLLFEPRFSEVERALDELKRQVHDSKLTNIDAMNEVGSLLVADTCVTDLRTYRAARQSLQHISNPVPRHPDAEYRAQLDKREQSVIAAGKEIDACLKHANEYLH